MEAQAWTTIGLLAATLFSALIYLGNRIDGLGNRIDGLGARLDGRMDALTSEVRSQATRIDGLGERIDTLGARLDARIEEQGAQLGNRLYELAIKLDDHLRRQAS